MKKDLSRHTLRSLFEIASTMLLLALVYACDNKTTISESEVVRTKEFEGQAVKYITEQQLAKLYTCKEEVRNDTCLVISIEDAERLMKLAVVEDYTDEYSQAWIMSVILNRVDSPLFPDTVEEVIAQKSPIQFATYYNGRYQKAEPDVNSHLALALIEAGEVKTDAIFFEAETSSDSWMSRNLEYIDTVGETKFYK